MVLALSRFYGNTILADFQSKKYMDNAVNNCYLSCCWYMFPHENRMVTLGNYFCYDNFSLFCFRSLVASVCAQNRGFKVLDFFCLGISLMVVQYLVLPFTGADLGGQKFSYPQLYIPISVLGIGAWLMIAKGIRKNTLLEWMGRNTLVLFAFQEPVYRMVIFIMSKVVNQPTDFIRTDLLCALLCTVLSIIVIAPLVWGYGKYVNPVIKRL